MSEKTQPKFIFLPEKKNLFNISQNFTSVGNLSYEVKLSTARKKLELLLKKFPHSIDNLILKELDKITACLDSDFIHQRDANHLAKLAYSTYFSRKKLLRLKTLFPIKEHFDIRLLPSYLHFTFGSKQVLGILAHVHLKDKYEIFDEEQVLFLIQKIIPEVQLVKGSVYTFKAPRNTIKTVYFEINKKNGIPFNLEEIKQLKELLKQEIRFSIEQLVPRIFMVRNEEEILKSILILSQEVRLISDLPQVMILFYQQTSKEVIFTIILVRVHKTNSLNIQEYFRKKVPDFECFYERCQVVKYLKKKHPVEANVFRINLAKNPSLLRTDLSLDFYLARQQISQILTEVVGEFRDYNGGIILKQREVLNAFKDTFREISIKIPDLVENFYYSLTPIEVQAILPLEKLKLFFSLFLSGLKYNFIQASDYFLKFARDNNQHFIMIRIPDESFKETMEEILSSFKDIQRIATSFINMQNTYCLGYLFEANEIIQDQISHKTLHSLKSWKQKLDKQQVLKIAIEPPIVSLDPRIGGDQISSLVLKMLFEGLMRINKEGKLEYGLAEKVDISEDQKTYLFTLRRAFWSNKSPVSALDFEYAWKKILSPTFKTPFAYLFYPIRNAKRVKNGILPPNNVGIKALDDLTLKIELESPAPYFLELTAHTIYSPINNLIDQKHPNWSFEDKERYVCNGAFQLKKNKSNEEYELMKNPLYWDCQNIKLEKATILKANRHQAYEMFQNNIIHWIGSPLGTWDPNFTSTTNDESVSFFDNNTYWYVFNTRQFPFNSKKMRQAFSLAINRSELSALNGFLPVISPLPPLHSQISKPIPSTFDIDVAKSLFEEALEEINLLPQDFPIISLKHLTGNISKKIAEQIKHQWEKAFGIRCFVEQVEWNTLFSNLTEGNFQVGGMAWEAWINDPIYTLNSFRDANDPINFSKWETIKYQQILDQADREVDLQKRQFYYLQAEKILLDEMPVAAICSIPSRAFKKKKFNINFSSSLLNFKWGYFS